MPVLVLVWIIGRDGHGMPAKPDPANFEIHLMPASKNLSNAILSLFKCRQLAGMPASLTAPVLYPYKKLPASLKTLPACRQDVPATIYALRHQKELFLK